VTIYAPLSLSSTPARGPIIRCKSFSPPYPFSFIPAHSWNGTTHSSYWNYEVLFMHSTKVGLSCPFPVSFPRFQALLTPSVAIFFFLAKPSGCFSSLFVLVPVPPAFVSLAFLFYSRSLANTASSSSGILVPFSFRMKFSPRFLVIFAFFFFFLASISGYF